MAKTRPHYSPVNPPVFWTTAVIILAFVLWAWLWPDAAETFIFGSMDWIATNLGWYYILTAGVIVLFVLVVAFSRVGQTKIGPDHSTPVFNMFTWSAMLFAAGIGVDLMFFGVSGPATNYLTPPDVAAMSDEAARMAPIWMIFHYGIPGWAMYALMGMAFGLFAYRYHLPLSIRSALAPIVGKRVRGPIGDGVEIAATLGTIFGIATSLGIGVVFLNYGLHYLFGWETGTTVQVALVVLAVGITIISTVSGVDKGIRRLSELNVFLAIFLMLWVLFSGNTAHLLSALVQNTGDFVSRFPGMMLDNFAFTDGGDPSYPSQDWLKDWTLFFWAWWIAWAPFVGLFLARISRGRTLRQFVIGVLVIPFLFILLWVSIFGNAALDIFRTGEIDFLNEAVEVPESAYFTLLDHFPGALFTIGLSVFTGLFFYVTSADSGSLILATMTSKSSAKRDSDGAPWLRIVWAVITGLLTLVMLFINGVYTLQAATVLMGLPFSVVMYLVMYSLFRVLRSERNSLDSRRAALPSLLSGRIRATGPGEKTSWRRRLARRMSYPGLKDTREFLDKTAEPAIREIAAEMKRLGADVTCTCGEHPDYPLPYVDLVVKFEDQDEFKYEAYPVAYPVPDFAHNLRTASDVYFQVEVFTGTGSQGHDILGYTHEQVISDVLDLYDAHLTFMTMTGDRGTPTKAVYSAPPSEWDDADNLPDDTDPEEVVAGDSEDAGR